MGYFPLNPWHTVEITLNTHYAPAMPIYEFHCAKCGEDSEVLVRTSNWEGTPCPHCGSKKLSKKLSVFASSVPASGDPAPACGMKGGGGGGCCGCAAGRPHKH
jgi:putative FmdB family regulatory protein